MLSQWINTLKTSLRFVVVTVATVLSFTTSASEPSHAQEPIQVVDVGVLAVRGKLAAKTRWQPTMDWLSASIPNTQFILRPFTLEEMAQNVKTLNVDFVVTNPGQAVQLGRQYALSWMATMTIDTLVPTYGIGSALVVRRLSPYISFEQLIGKPIAAVGKSAFGGYLTMRYQALQQGIDPQDFFSDIRLLGFPVDVSLYQLRDNQIEAAIVPACLLENMTKEGLIDGHKFRVVQNIAPAGFECDVSTPLYPNWSFAKTDRTSSSLAKLVAGALFAMPSDSDAAIAAGASGWTSPVSLLSIDKLYKDLDIHPLQNRWWNEAIIWLKHNQQWAWVFFLVVVVVNGYHFWLEYRFSRSKKQLEETLHSLKEKSEQLEHSQRVAIVGELGSSLAHEINQPLAAIRNYSEGGLLRLAKLRPYEDIVPVFEKIQCQVERADAIIQRLRGMIKKRSSIKTDTDIEYIISETLELLAFRMNRHKIKLIRQVKGTPVSFNVDAVGLQQVIVNVMNNAIDACVSYQNERFDYLESKASPDLPSNNSSRSKITIIAHYGLVSDEGTHHMKSSDSNVLFQLLVVDNGTGLNDSVSQYTQAFVSTKNEGLGLGLAICCDVIEAHHGTFSIESIQPHGCKVAFSLPYSTGSS